jgi:hypothetical protein
VAVVRRAEQVWRGLEGPGRFPSGSRGSRSAQVWAGVRSHWHVLDYLDRCREGGQVWQGWHGLNPAVCGDVDLSKVWSSMAGLSGDRRS